MTCTLSHRGFVRFVEREVRMSRVQMKASHQPAAWTRTIRRCSHSATPSERVHAERNADFFAEWSAKRVYFYQVDLRGRLFLETPNFLRRNDATCLKSLQFLDFFFSRVRPCPSPDEVKSNVWRNAIQLFSNEFPYISPCGRELNLLKAEDTPIVFKELIQREGEADALVFGGSLQEPFDPAQLFVGKETERIYYERSNGDVCLVHADLAQRLSKGFSGEGWWDYKGNQYRLLTK